MTRRVRLVATSLAAMVLASLSLVCASPASAAPGPWQAPEYWFDSWDVPGLWDAGARGQGVVIAEIDTGVNAELPALRGKILKGKDFGKQGGDGRTDRDKQPFGHGTAMASIMVARKGLRGIVGIAPDARILPVAVPLTGTTDASGDDHLAAAIRWSVDHGAKVISMSLGGVRRQAQNPQPCPPDEQQAIYYALRHGAVLLAAAGNRGGKADAVEEPGVCLGVAAVAAIDRSGTVADFSSRHPYTTMAAPGVDIPSLGRVPGTIYVGRGTSQATAITSAVLALVWSKHPDLTGSQVLARVLATLDDAPTGGADTPSPAYGYGIVNAKRAVTAPVPANAPNPVYAGAAPFIAHARAAARYEAPPAPDPAPATTPRVGSFSRGDPPPAVDAATITGGAVALAGLLCLAVLSLLGVRAQRHRRVLVAAPMPEPAAPDGAGLVWREIGDTEPEDASRPDT